MLSTLKICEYRHKERNDNYLSNLCDAELVFLWDGQFHNRNLKKSFNMSQQLSIETGTMRNQAVESSNNLELRAQHPKCYPFVKWAGGKTQLIPNLSKHIPPNLIDIWNPFWVVLHFSFISASDVNLRFKPLLSDTNTELINTYKVVRNSVDELIKILKYHQVQYNLSPYEYYYELRARVKPSK